MKLSKFRVVLLGLLALGILGTVGVYIFRAPIKASVNEARAERIFSRAQVAFEAQQWIEASRLGIAAHHLDRGNSEINLLVARALLKQRNAATVDWWMLVLDHPDLPIDELRDLTMALLSAKQLEEAIPFLSRLVALDGDNPDTHRLWLESLQIQHRYGKVRTLAGEFAEKGSEDWSIHSAYIRIQRGLSGNESTEVVINHLSELLESKGPLALNAARELAVIENADPEVRAKASIYLRENADEPIDRLFATGVEIKLGVKPVEAAHPLVEALLSEPGPGDLEKLLQWGNWMNSGSWLLDKVSWDLYQANGGSADAYLKLLLAEGLYSRLLELTETASSEGGEEMATFLYYRSLALNETGETEDALATLNLAVETVDPEHYFSLERYLVRDGRWILLSRLYDLLRADNPEEPVFAVKALLARYYSGQQDDMQSLLKTIDVENFGTQPDIQGFIYYIKLLQEGSSKETHNEVEALLAEFPEIFDFRLVLGVSYVLQGQRAVGRQLVEGMPKLGMNAPRYVRVAAVILGGSADDLISLSEREILLPRERFLMSLREQ